MRVRRREGSVVELRLIADDHLCAVGHDSEHVAYPAATKAETASLSAGEVGDPIVGAEDGTGRVDDGPRRDGLALSFDEITHAAVRDEAELLRLGLVCVRDTKPASSLSNLRLCQVAEREHEPLEGRLREPKEEIALVLVLVATPQEAELAVRGSGEARVVSRGDVACVEAARDLSEMGELHCPIAAHAGDGGPPRSVFRHEGVDHVSAERLTLVEHVVRDAEVLAGPSGIVTVLGRAAAPDLVLTVRVPEMKGDPDDVVTGLV